MTEPSHDELQPGAVLQQRYEIVRRIGAGGFGEVYLAKHRKFRQRVAVKKLRAAVASEAMREQFEKEAALLFGLSHRGLPKVVDAFSQDDSEFLVMEFVEGKDLAEILQEQRGPVDLARVLAWADQILDALEYLHTRRPPVIHRDIKPQNVKLCSDGRVVLLDFGLAKGASGLMWSTTAPRVGGAATDEDGPLGLASKSVAALSMGFSPLEQMVQQPTDERSDLYSFAATLYALLAYAIPEQAVLRGAATATGRPDPLVPIRARNPLVPEAVEQVILGALAIHREDRPASASAFRAALNRAAVSAPSRDEPSVEPMGPSDLYVPTVVDATELVPPSQSSVAPAEPAPDTATPLVGVRTGTRLEEAKTERVPAERGTTEYDTLPVMPDEPPGPPRPPTEVAPAVAPPVTQPPTPRPRTLEAPVDRTVGVPAKPWSAAKALVAALGLLGLLACVWLGWWILGPKTGNPEVDVSPSTPQPGVSEPAPATPKVELFRFRLERMDGTPLDLAAGRLPKEIEFRIKISASADGRIFLVLINPDQSYTVYVSDRPSAETGIASNVVRAGQDFVFPGKGLPFSVEQGTERLLLGFAPSGVTVPAGLAGKPLATLSADDVAAIERALTGPSAETQQDDGRVAVRVNRDDTKGLVVVDVNEMSTRARGQK